MVVLLCGGGCYVWRWAAAVAAVAAAAAVVAAAATVVGHGGGYCCCCGGTTGPVVVVLLRRGGGTAAAKPGTKNYGCGYFDWKDAFDERLMVSSSSTSEGSSGPYRSEQPQPSYSPGLTILAQPTSSIFRTSDLALKARLRMLEARLEMERNLEDHACQSGAILNELLDDMKDLHME
ncbi:hypothetical protein Tco_0212194 [Tanacetum coccineum]